MAGEANLGTLMAHIGLDTSQLGRSVTVAGRMLGGLRDSVFSLQSAMGLLGGAVIAKKIFDVGASTQAIKRGFEAATGSAKQAAKEYEFLAQTADKLGLELASAGKAFVSLVAAVKGTALEGRGAEKVFVAVSSAATALGLSSETAEGALLAIQQMMSKGTVSAEELRGQLGERIPGAFNIFAEAMGVSTRKLGEMLQKGEILADEALPKLADVLTKRFGKAAEEASTGAIAQLNRFHNAVREVFNTLASSGILDAFGKSLRSITEELKRPEMTQGLISLGRSIGILAESIGKLLALSGRLFSFLDKLGGIETLAGIGLGAKIGAGLGSAFLGPGPGTALGAATGGAVGGILGSSLRRTAAGFGNQKLITEKELGALERERTQKMGELALESSRIGPPARDEKRIGALKEELFLINVQIESLKKKILLEAAPEAIPLSSKLGLMKPKTEEGLKKEAEALKKFNAERIESERNWLEFRVESGKATSKDLIEFLDWEALRLENLHDKGILDENEFMKAQLDNTRAVFEARKSAADVAARLNEENASRWKQHIDQLRQEIDVTRKWSENRVEIEKSFLEFRVAQGMATTKELLTFYQEEADRLEELHKLGQIDELEFMRRSLDNQKDQARVREDIEKEHTPVTRKQAGLVSSIWDAAARSIEGAFGDAFSGVKKQGGLLYNFFKDLVVSIRNLFVQLLAKQIIQVIQDIFGQIKGKVGGGGAPSGLMAGLSGAGGGAGGLGGIISNLGGSLIGRGATSLLGSIFGAGAAGAAGGAGAGATLGTAVLPIIGTVIGAIGGSLISRLFGGKKKDPVRRAIQEWVSGTLWPELARLERMGFGMGAFGSSHPGGTAFFKAMGFTAGIPQAILKRMQDMARSLADILGSALGSAFKAFDPKSGADAFFRSLRSGLAEYVQKGLIEGLLKGSQMTRALVPFFERVSELTRQFGKGKIGAGTFETLINQAFAAVAPQISRLRGPAETLSGILQRINALITRNDNQGGAFRSLPPSVLQEALAGGIRVTVNATINQPMDAVLAGRGVAFGLQEELLRIAR